MKLPYRSRPTVREQQRQRSRPATLLVEIVQINARQRHGELAKSGELRFLCTPVKIIASIRKQIPQVADAGARAPGLQWRLVRQPRSAQAFAQVRQILLADPELKRTGLGHGCAERLVAIARRCPGP